MTNFEYLQDKDNLAEYIANKQKSCINPNRASTEECKSCKICALEFLDKEKTQI